MLRARRTRDDMTILLLGPSALTHSLGLFSKSSIFMMALPGGTHRAHRLLPLRFHFANLVADLRRVLVLLFADRLLQLLCQFLHLAAQGQCVLSLGRHLAHVV